MRNTADDAIAKRRAELRRLQQQRGKSAGITERLSQAAAASSNRGAPMMRSVVVNNHNTSRFGAAASKMTGGKTQQVTARRLDESYKTNNNNGVATNNFKSAAANGPPAPQKMTNTNNSAAASSIPIMAAKRTSEIFPPKRSSTSSSISSSSAVNRQQNQTNIAPPATMPSNNNNNMTMGSTNSHHYQQQPPPPQQQQSATKPPPKQQYSQYQQPPQPQQPPPAVTNSPIIHNYNHHQSPSLNSIQSTSSYGSSSNSNNTTKSPFGQARVTKVIPALSLNGTHGGGLGGVKSLVPPLSMLDPPPLLDEAAKVGGGSAGGVTAAPSVVKVPLKTVNVAKKLSSVKGDDANDTDKLTTPRERKEDEKEGEIINSGQSTPIHANLMEESPPKSVVAAAASDDGGGSTGAGDDGKKSKTAVLPDVNATLQEAKMALVQEKVDGADITATNNETDSSPKENEKEEEEVNHQPQSKKEEEKHIPEKDESSNTSNGKNTNLSRLKLDLERSEKEKLEALEQVAKLKSLLEAGGVGSSNGGEAPRSLDQMRSTIDSPRRTVTTPRSGGGGGFGIGGGITTPRGGNTPNRFTPNRSHLPPLAWGTPRSGNSRAGSRTGSPEHHGHYGSMSGTPRVRASPLPKQLNRVVSDTQLNKKAGDDDDGTTPQEERVEEQFLVAAARSIPNEYGTPLASYFVRRPHMTDDSLEKNETDELAKLAIDLWGNKCTHLSSSDDYKKYASVFRPESLEIVACIEADGSVFTLSGECNARHGKVSTMSSNNGSFDEDDSNIVDKEYDWIVFDNVEEMDRALGRVSYIDEEGNEREYWLGK